MKRLLIRIVVVLALIEVAYLAVFNVVLNLPATQTYLNQMRPERITYHWDRAWTWYPFNIHATGLMLNGQGWSQQWQVSAPAISAHFSILPLFAKTLRFSNIETADVDIRFRPRPSPDRDDAASRPYFPPIEGRDPNAPADPAPTQTPGWMTVFDIAGIGGQNEVWMGPVKMTLVGEGGFTMARQNRNGPMTISDGVLDMAVKGLSIDGKPVSDDGSIKGTFDIATYLPQENRGLKLLPFLSMDVDIDLPINGLDFLDPYLTKVSGMKLGGNGTLKGHIGYDEGLLAKGTDLEIAAEDLTVDMTYYSAAGAGTVGIKVAGDSAETLALDYRLKAISAYHEPGHATLFTGTDLQIAVERSNRVLPGTDEDKGLKRIAMTIPKVTVPDITAYQRYLPEKWNIQLLGGTGSLEGKAEISTSKLDFDLTIRSENADVHFEDNDSFETGLTFGFKVTGDASDTEGKVDFSGTYVELDETDVKTKKGDDSEPWKARLAISEGDAQFALTDSDHPAGGYHGFWILFHGRDMKDVLGSLDGMLKASLTVSDLNWVNLLLRNPYSLAIHNSAEVLADLTIQGGKLAEGSSVKMPTSNFRVEVLDYVAIGNGGFDLVVEKGGEVPDIRFDATLADASLQLKDEKEAVISQMTLAITARAQGVSAKSGGAVKSVELNIPSAKVTNMAAYNEYIPKSAPVRILGGTADMSAKLNIEEKTSTGFVKLKTSRIDADLDGQRVSGVVTVDVVIDGGSAKEKAFDISGSFLKLDGLRVAGEHGPSGDWSGEIKLTKGNVAWKKPMKLDVTTSLYMSDVRPLVAIFEAQRKSHKWIERVLALKNVRGTATINISPNDVVVPYALAKADPVEVGVKGLIRDKHREGIFYARYNKLSGILEIDGSEKRFGLINAEKKFEAYKPGGPLPGMRETDRPNAETKAPRAKRKPFSIFKRK